MPQLADLERQHEGSYLSLGPMLSRRTVSQEHFQVVCLRTETSEAPTLVVSTLRLETCTQCILNLPLALSRLDPGVTSIVNPSWQVPMDFSKHDRHRLSELSNQLSSTHHHPRTRSSKGFVVAFEQLSRKLAPSKQSVPGFQGAVEVNRLPKIGPLNGEHRSIHCPSPLRRCCLGQTQVIGSENHDPRSLQRLRIAPNGLAVQGDALFADSNFHSKSPVQAAQGDPRFDLRLLPPPANKIAGAARSERAKSDGVVRCFQKVALPLAVPPEKHGNSLAERKTLFDKVPPAPDAYVS